MNSDSAYELRVIRGGKAVLTSISGREIEGRPPCNTDGDIRALATWLLDEAHREVGKTHTVVDSVGLASIDPDRLGFDEFEKLSTIVFGDPHDFTAHDVFAKAVFAKARASHPHLFETFLEQRCATLGSEASSNWRAALQEARDVLMQALASRNVVTQALRSGPPADRVLILGAVADMNAGDDGASEGVVFLLTWSAAVRKQLDDCATICREQGATSITVPVAVHITDALSDDGDIEERLLEANEAESYSPVVIDASDMPDFKASARLGTPHLVITPASWRLVCVDRDTGVTVTSPRVEHALDPLALVDTPVSKASAPGFG